jgi:hypothetical protein
LPFDPEELVDGFEGCGEFFGVSRLDCAEGALDVEGLRGKGFGDFGYDGDVEEGGEAGAVVGDVFVFV